MQDSYDFTNARRGRHAEFLRNGGTLHITNEDGTQELVLTGEDVARANPHQVRQEGMRQLLQHLQHLGVHYAETANDPQVQLIAYRPVSEAGRRFLACPVVLTVSSKTRVHLHTANEGIPNLLLAFVWNVGEEPEIYAMPFFELKQVFESRGYTSKPSYQELGGWSVPSTDPELLEFMQRHRITSGAEWEREVEAALQVI